MRRDSGESARARGAGLSRPPAVRASLLVAALLLLTGFGYGVIAYEPEEHTDLWTGPVPGAVESGNCSRALRLLPSREPLPPDFVRFGGRTYVRLPEQPSTLPRLRDTRYRLHVWKLMRAGERLYLQRRAREEQALPLLAYAPGECR